MTGELSNDPAARTVFAATDGDDGNDGTVQRPFASLPRARDAIREIRIKDEGVKRSRTVQVRGGKQME